MNPKISVDEFDRDKRITVLERQVLMLSAQIYARDAAIAQLLQQMLLKENDEAIEFVTEFPSMMAEIDIKVLESLSQADATEKATS